MLVSLLRFIRRSLDRLGLLPWAKSRVRWLLARLSRPPFGGPLTYRLRAAIEQANYAEVTEVHDLPAIFHYWSNRYLLPKCQTFGFSTPAEFFENELLKVLKSPGPHRFVSIGSGNGDLEVALAAALVARGHHDFTLECVDLNEAMLQRAAEAASAAGVTQQVRFTRADFNTWQPATTYHAVIANQSLHHVVALEHLFDNIAAHLAPGGRFITADMIGRNGHQRWPEARAIIDEFWRELPAEKRRNRLLGRTEARFMDWDCSVAGFEGVRAQDILPLLIERFHFEMFLPFGNLIDPFTDRAFGHNFSVDSAEDRAFIDRVHQRDEEEIAAGRLSPTHLFAVLSVEPVSAPRFLPGLTPAFCLRKVA